MILMKNVTVFTVSECHTDTTVYQIMLTTEYKKGRLDERQNLWEFTAVLLQEPLLIEFSEAEGHEKRGKCLISIETLSFVTINSEIFLVKWCLWMVNVFLLYRSIILPDLSQTNVWLNALWQISFWRESLLLLWSSLSGFQQVCPWMDQEWPPLKKTPNRICQTMLSSPGFDTKDSVRGNDSITNRYTENVFNSAVWILDSIIKCTTVQYFQHAV